MITRIRKQPSRGVLEAIGQTPLVELTRFLENQHVELFAKLEACNPGGSAKDRPARQMIDHAIQEGRINRDTTVIESSSGNMGIGLAQACRFYGLKFVCVVDPHIQSQNRKILEALGVEIHMVNTPINGSFLTARLTALRRYRSRFPNTFWPNQYENDQNPVAHFEGTIAEIDQALGGQFDYLFVATSSTGTLQGCERYLATRRRHAEVVAVDAIGSVLFGGVIGDRKIPGLGAGQVPPLAVNVRTETIRRISDLDCVIGCRRLALTEGILAGGSAGGVLQAIREVQDRLSGKRCVAILHDSGTRYLDTVFSDEWVENVLHTSPEEIQRRITDEMSFEQKESPCPV